MGTSPTRGSLDVVLEALQVMVVVRIDQERFNLMLKQAHLTRGWDGVDLENKPKNIPNG